MKLNKVAMAVALTAVLGSMSAMAAVTDTTSGVIELQGELVNTACGLAPSSSPVTVDFGQVPVSLLQNGGQATETKNIELQYCDTTVAKTAVVSYTPTVVSPADASLAAFTSGSAAGAGIVLKDSASQDVTWGAATTPVTLVNGNSIIPFVAILKAEAKSADGTAPVVTAGDFKSTINFTIAYQ
ncbi:fimbrial protein [Klebsiella sp. BIGb0407]|uniref:fimbrial protein n=1 Tax=Klebsiella sp. BIGb0407 TaxID=2940603 RepID=UPI00216A8B5D|nr:fimbrial protein [Klebsiella sp. BIGb0407]MCS3430283.1 type 1 fimbria pilin [Klebsiella sp. BIGb0407]